jgi:hypothetical protein
VKAARSPINSLINASTLRCVLCDKPPGCGCWTQCKCGWSFQKGGICQNPEHSTEPLIELTAAAKAWKRNRSQGEAWLLAAIEQLERLGW